MKIKNIVENIIAISFISLLFIFSLTWIIFNFNDSSSALKDSWSTIGSIFGGITTLIAAYIAYYLYDDWKNPHNFNIETEHKKEILKVIRKLIPLENKYDQLISNHFIYKSQPNRTIPIEINKDELNSLIYNINELIGLLDELYFISNDPNIKNLKIHYLKYAQLYAFILRRAEYLYHNGTSAELWEFLQTSLEFDYIELDNRTWNSYTLYAYAFNGLTKVNLRKYISENLKLK